MADGDLSRKGVNEIYEEGKHRRYSLLFSVNGAALAIGKLAVGGSEQERAVLGGLTVTRLAIAMAVFSLVMSADSWSFGAKMHRLDKTLFRWQGKAVLFWLGALLIIAWGFVAAARSSANV